MSAPLQPLSALVGRTREVAELDLALDRLAAGTPWSLQIIGEPGIGKSRLLAELNQRAQARGYLVLKGRAAEFELDVPFGVLLDAFNDYFGSLEPSFLQSLGTETLGELAAIFPSLTASVDALPAPRLQAERYRIHYAIRGHARAPGRAAADRRDARRRAMGRRGFGRDDRPRASAGSAARSWARSRSGTRPLRLADAVRRGRPRRHRRPAGARAAHRGAGAVVDGSRPRSRAARLALPRERRKSLLPRRADAVGPRRRAPQRLGDAKTPARNGRLRPRWPRQSAPSSPSCRRTRGSPPTRPRSRVSRSCPVSSRSSPSCRNLRWSPRSTSCSHADLIRPTESSRYFRFRHPIVRRAVYDSTPGAWQLGAHARTARRSKASIDRRARSHITSSGRRRLGDEDAIAVLVEGCARSRAARAAHRRRLVARRVATPLAR